MFLNIELNDFTIMGVDPGISHMGLSAIVVSPDLRSIKYIAGRTSHGDDANLDSNYAYYVDDRYAKIKHHDGFISAWLYTYKPSFLVYEKPFIHSSRPAAYGALIESTCCIKDAAQRYSPYVDVYEYAPLSIKKRVHAEGFNSKEYVKDALLGINEISYFIKNQMVSLDEHSLDAIAIAYTHLLNLRDGLV